ncbi:MAG: hypothetical protein SH809_07630 [Rhodothermales bacterium]|nr:hypothetical protein [Rhodothermales bacterium]
MKRTHPILPALAFFLLVFVAVGCDGTEDTSDLEQFIGTWELTGASDEEGDKTAVFSQLGTLTLSLEEEGSHALTVDIVAPEEEDVSLAGTYTVNEATRQLLLAVTFSGVPFSLGFDYVIEDADTIVLTADSTVLVALLGAEAGSLLTGDVTLTIERTS